MPRYYFHLYNDETSLDEEGTELADFAAAEAFGAVNAREMAADSVLQGALTLHHRIDIADVHGKVLKSIPFSDVVVVSA